MEVFEFQINPRLKKSFLFESFCFSPKNIYEKSLGHLFCVGILKNFPPKKATFLSQFSLFLKENFFKNFSRKQIFAFKEALRKANLFLEDLLKKGEDFWCFNLDFFVLNLWGRNFIFSKTGNLKIFVCRSGKLFNLEKKFKEKKLGLKVFNKIARGRLREEDTLLILNPEIFNILNQEKAFKKISNFDEATLREFLKERERIFGKNSGIIFGIHLKKEPKGRALAEKFELKKIWKSLSLPQFPKEKIFLFLKKRNLLLILLLVLILILGRIFGK